LFTAEGVTASKYSRNGDRKEHFSNKLSIGKIYFLKQIYSKKFGIKKDEMSNLSYYIASNFVIKYFVTPYVRSSG
jgi:hypothetical protein